MVLDRHSAPVMDKEGKYYGRIWTFHDITVGSELLAWLIDHVGSIDIIVQARHGYLWMLYLRYRHVFVILDYHGGLL
jgi:hypothetical protein